MTGNGIWTSCSKIAAYSMTHHQAVLIRIKDTFGINSPTDNTRFRVKLDSVKMIIRKVQVNPVIRVAHAKALEMETAKYPITCGECNTCTVNSGTRNHTEENLYSGQIPKFSVIGFIKNSGINGTYQTNPFQFEHFDMDHIAPSMGGTSVPGMTLQPDFSSLAWDHCIKMKGTKQIGRSIKRDIP